MSNDAGHDLMEMIAESEVTRVPRFRMRYPALIRNESHYPLYRSLWLGSHTMISPYPSENRAL